MTDSPLVVVKIGGSTLGMRDTSLADIAQLQREGRRVVVVHGGGPAISDWLKRLDTPTRFVRGLRVTDAATLDVAVAVLAGAVNKQLVASLCALGTRACGLSGADGATLTAAYEDEDLGYVGRVVRVDVALLDALLDAGCLPVVAPIALLAGDGDSPSNAQLLNVNADTVAGELARALSAGRLVFLTDVEGVRGGDGAVLRDLDQARTEELLAAGVIAGGMIPKVAAGLRAGSAGATCVILDGRQPRSLLSALDADPPGTVIAGVAAPGGRGG
jgi:acetylglutamate kinase